jgi:5-(carboxyamino)imidazole ribonucleotide synthase
MILPGGTIGVLGGGQLGRMMALAARRMGYRIIVLDPSAKCPTAQVADGVVVGALDDVTAAKELARQVDVITLDTEHVHADVLDQLEAIAPVRPGASVLRTIQDRRTQKEFLDRLGLPQARWAPATTRGELDAALDKLGKPAIVKVRRAGYDGKGQVRIDRARDAAPAFAKLAGQPLVYERFVNFTREVSLVAARGRDGAVAFYPLAENEHAGGILALTRAPFVDARLQRAAERNHRRLFRALGYIGVLCVEYFVDRGRLVANEMAPRVHNSGHWSIEGAETSQFENHVRAVAGLPLGSTALRGHAAMVNVIGGKPDAAGLLAQPGLHWHDYGKAPRPGRKLGHVTFVTGSASRRDRVARQLRRRLNPLS